MLCRRRRRSVERSSVPLGSGTWLWVKREEHFSKEEEECEKRGGGRQKRRLPEGILIDAAERRRRRREGSWKRSQSVREGRRVTNWKGCRTRWGFGTGARRHWSITTRLDHPRTDNIYAIVPSNYVEFPIKLTGSAHTIYSCCDTLQRTNIPSLYVVNNVVLLCSVNLTRNIVLSGWDVRTSHIAMLLPTIRTGHSYGLDLLWFWPVSQSVIRNNRFFGLHRVAKSLAFV